MPKANSKRRGQLVSSPLDDIGMSVRPQRGKREPTASRMTTAGPSPAAAPAQPVTGRRARVWEANHKPETFYCPVDLSQDVRREMANSGRSKSQVIVDALCQYLGVTPRGRGPAV